MTDHLAALRIEPIQKDQNFKSFDCGEPSLNDYLVRYAWKNDQGNISKTFVLVDSDKNIYGYYSIYSASIGFEMLPEASAKHLPRYPIPCARLARLAVTGSCQGKGAGARLLIDALHRINQVSFELGIKFIIVDALNETAGKFYQHYGFIALPGQDLKLFLPMETINLLFE